MAPGKKTGGRKAGTPNKRKSAFREALQEYCNTIQVDPHRYMADLIADKSTRVIGQTVNAQGEAELVTEATVSTLLKFQAARELAQYLAPKLKAIEHSGDIDHNVKVIEHRYGRTAKRD